MPGTFEKPKSVDPEGALRAYFRHELDRAQTRLPSLPPLPTSSIEPRETAIGKAGPRPGPGPETERLGYGYRGNLSGLLLAACVLAVSALALSCAPRTALARSIGRVVDGQGLSTLSQRTSETASLIWQQGQEHFRKKATAIKPVVRSTVAE